MRLAHLLLLKKSTFHTGRCFFHICLKAAISLFFFSGFAPAAVAVSAFLFAVAIAVTVTVTIAVTVAAAFAGASAAFGAVENETADICAAVAQGLYSIQHLRTGGKIPADDIDHLV